MTHSFLPAARDELFQAQTYYEQNRDGLGSEFVDAVIAAIQIIMEQPVRWPALGRRTRRYCLHRFPYALIYESTANEVVIVAVAHNHRRPGYWRRRLP